MTSINNRIKNVFKELKLPSHLDHVAMQTLSLMDLTRYHIDDTEEIIRYLCKEAKTPYGDVAAVCAAPRFVKLAKSLLKNSTVRVVSHIDMFKNPPLARIISDIEKAIADEASAIEVVFPYHAYLEGRLDEAEKFIRECSMACAHQVFLKITIEVSVYSSYQAIYDAARYMIDIGVDFIKTSTGRKPISVTPEIAAAILLAIKDSGENIGFKPAIGIDTIEQASQYLALTEQILNADWLRSETFRIGADEKLLNDAKKTLEAFSLL